MVMVVWCTEGRRTGGGCDVQRVDGWVRDVVYKGQRDGRGECDVQWTDRRAGKCGVRRAGAQARGV